MSPAFIVHADDASLREGVCGFDRIVVVHSEMVWPPRLRRTCEQDHQPRPESFRNIGDAFIPNRVPGDVDGVSWRLQSEHKTRDIAHRALNAMRTVARR